MRFSHDLCFLLESARTRIRGNAPFLGYYWGWVRQGNLGDDAIQQAIYEMFGGHIVFLDSQKGILIRALERIRKIPFDISLMGGGTFIFENEDELMKLSRNDVRRRVIFGSGAANLEFLDYMGQGGASQAEKWSGALASADYVGVRGPYSKKLVEQYGAKNANLIGDPALWFTRPLQAKPSASKRLAVNFGTTRNILWGKDEPAFLDEFGRFVRRMFDDGWQIEILPVWLEDLPVIHRILSSQGLDGKIPVFKNYTSVQGFIDHAATFDVMIGLKLHAVILSYCANTPAVMIEYRPKCRDFMASIGMEDMNLRTDQFRADSAAQMVGHIYENRQMYRSKGNAACTGYQAKLKQAAGEVLEILGKP